MKLKTFILCLLCIVLLCSCSEGEVSLDAPMDDYKGDLVTIIDGDTINYTVIRAEESSVSVTQSAIKLRQTLSEKYSCRFPIDTDWVKRGEQVPTDTYEILVGPTNRAESIAAEKELGANDFVILFSGNRIVILGGSDKSTERAVDYFIEKICVEDGTKLEVPASLKLLSKDNYILDTFTLLGKNIYEYSIAYDFENDALQAAATALSDNIKSYAGYTLPQIDEKELTLPSLVLKIAQVQTPSTAYDVRTEGENVIFEADSELGLIYAVSAIFEETLGVKGDNITDPYNAVLDDISLSASGYESGIETLAYTLFNMDRAALLVSYEGQVLGVYDRRNGKNHIDTDKDSPFAILNKDSDEKPSSAFSIDGDKCIVGFGDESVEFNINFTGDFVSFELVDALEGTDTTLRFLNMNLDPDSVPEDEDDFAVSNYAMTYFLNPNYYPDGKSRTIGMTAYGRFESEGAKGALVASAKNEMRDVMKSANKYIEEGMAAVSDKGGANALDYEKNFGNYFIVSDSDSELIAGWIELAAKYDIDQFDFHKGASTFHNGSFAFTKTGSAEGFREKIAQPLKDAGLQSGLHTYAFYIDPGATDILSDPECQKQFEVIREYTLAEDIKKVTSKIKIKESLDGVSVITKSSNHGTNYLLIDEEIVMLSTVGSDSFVVQRGVCGTTAAEHTAGAKIKHLGGCWGGIAPDIDSELFLQIARNTAEAYNEGGFEMIYIDALDGLSRHTSSEYQWYYAAKFINEIFKYCNTDPIIEYSSMYPSIWISRGRAGALDHPRRAYKLGVDIHIDSNLPWENMHYTSTLGWYDLYPTDTKYPGNTNVEYHFFDDVDYVGTMSVAHDMSFVYQGIGKLKTHPAYVRNMERYAVYSKLRKEGYFSDEIKEQLKDGEHALVQKEDGSYVFVQKAYDKTKLYDITSEGTNTLTAENPFASQVPFVRIEGRFSTEGENPTTLLKAGESKSVSSLSYAPGVGGETNIEMNTAMKVSVLGNNSDDAICFRFACNTNSDSSTVDYIINLDFEGWREFVLAEPDNGTFDTSDFNLSASFYPYCRGVFEYGRVTEVTVHQKGTCEGVMISDLEACKYVSNAITNPSITVNGQTITFEGTIASDEYLEYFPEDGKAIIYDGYGNGREVNVKGKLPEIASGYFDATVSGIPENENAPLRASVTFGFTGEEVK